MLKNTHYLKYLFYSIMSFKVELLFQTTIPFNEPRKRKHLFKEQTN